MPPCYRLAKQLDGEGVERSAKFSVSNWSNEDFSLLAELGIRNSSVLLCNCTIWVEGITDRLYFRRYFEVYQASLPEVARRYLEDLHFSFVEYGGGNITHWSFLETEDHPIDVERLCGRVFLIADRDPAPVKKKRREQLRHNLGDRFCELPCREVENVLTPTVLSAVIEEYEGGQEGLSKFTYCQYRDKPLGRFIQSKIIQGSSKRRSQCGNAYAEQSGTVKGKVEFCEKSLKHISSADDLSDDAKEICRTLWQFVDEMNR